MEIEKLKIPRRPNYVQFKKDINFYNLFKKINNLFDVCFLLESLGEEGRLSRYSICGFDPKFIISGNKNILKIDGKEYKTKNPYFALQDIVPFDIISKAYSGGLVGYLNFDSVNYFEKSLNIKTHNLFPQFMFGFYTDGLVLDKITGEVFYFYYTKNRKNIIEKIYKEKKLKTEPVKISKIGESISKKEYFKIVKKVKNEIKKGNTFQCVIGFKKEYKIQGDALNIYSSLRKINPSPHMYYIKFKEIKLLGASPELLLRIRDKEMETFPLAGTIKRGRTKKEDAILARKLLNNPKEIAEHNMLIDLHRNDLGKVAEIGTVKIRRLKDIKKFKYVQHISSEITGIMGRGKNMFLCLASNFPAGTLSGAPKIESIKIIDLLENQARGPYGGAVGQFGFNGDCSFAIPIRSFFIYKDYAYTQNGSGIVYDSDPEKEYIEIKRKGKALEKTLKNFM